MCAGCSVLTSNLGALPETGLGFARHYGFISDKQKHIERFTRELKRTITEYRNGEFDNTFKLRWQINIIVGKPESKTGKNLPKNFGENLNGKIRKKLIYVWDMLIFYP